MQDDHTMELAQEITYSVLAKLSVPYVSCDCCEKMALLCVIMMWGVEFNKGSLG